MAKNSYREQIIEYWVDKFKAGETERTRSFKGIERVRPRFADLGTIPGTKLPMLAIVAGLPVPLPKKGKLHQAMRDIVISDLSIEFVAYAMDNVTPDSTISTLADDLWVTLYSDPTSGGLGLELDVKPEPVVGIWDPYLVFKMVCSIRYKHTIGGI